MDKQILEKLKGTCELCRKTGADDAQYILVPIGVLETLLSLVPEVEDEQNRGQEQADP